MCLVPDSNLSLWLFLVNLEILLQEPFLDQASQLVIEGYSSFDVVPKCSMELTLGISSRPQVLICLLGETLGCLLALAYPGIWVELLTLP